MSHQFLNTLSGYNKSVLIFFRFDRNKDTVFSPKIFFNYVMGILNYAGAKSQNVGNVAQG